MSIHPNVILLCTLTPDDLARKTYRAIVSDYKKKDYDEESPDLKIGDSTYHCKVLESDYDEDWQIGGEEGDILVFDLVTYGYGERIEWRKLEAQKNALEKWAVEACEKYSCKFAISVTANYW